MGQQNIMSEPNETGQVCKTLDSTISNKEFITSSGIMLVAPVLPLIYIDLAKPKSGAPGFFILTGCRISENKRLWNCLPFGFPGYCLIMSFSSLPN